MVTNLSHVITSFRRNLIKIDVLSVVLRPTQSRSDTIAPKSLHAVAAIFII